MRIVHIIEATFAGVGRHVLDLSVEQARQGHEVHVIYSPVRESASFADERQTTESSSSEGYVSWHSVSVDRSPSLRDVKALRSINQIVESVRPHVVHGHSTKGGLLARLCRSADAKVAYTPNALYSMSPGLGRRTAAAVAALERKLSKRTDVFVAVSPEELTHAHAIGLEPRTKVVIPNGVNPPERHDKAEVRRKLGVPGNGLVMGFVGRLDHQKAPERLIEIFEHAREDRPDIQLVVVGNGPDRDALRDEAAAKAFDGIVFAGTQPGTWAMNAFDVLLLPSRYEGFPYVLIEAAHLGLPIVASAEANASYLSDRYPAMNVHSGQDVAAMATSAVSLAENESVGEPKLDEFTADAMAAATVAAYNVGEPATLS